MKIPTNAIVSNLTPRFGLEIRGLSLATLDAEDRDQLTSYVARKGVIGFRGQDGFINDPAERYLDVRKALWPVIKR